MSEIMKNKIKNLVQWLRYKVVCAWCKKRMRGFFLARHTSHGMCAHCMVETQASWPQSDADSGIQNLQQTNN